MPFPDPGTLAVFAAAAIALLVIPGPAVLYIVAQSIEHGRGAGLVSMLGVQVGGLVHVAAAALGLSALLLQSATAFNIVKFAGAAYLVFLGLRKLLTPGAVRDDRRAPAAPARPALRPGDRRERPQPEDGALLLRVPAAVRGRRGKGSVGLQILGSASSSS